jgi:hypothetical protein
MDNLPNVLLSSIGEYLPDRNYFKYQRTSKQIIAANRDKTLERMNLPSVAPLPKWARALEKGLTYHVPSFTKIITEYNLSEPTEEEALVAALCSIIEKDRAGVGPDVSALRESYEKRDVAKQTRLAHRLVARVTIVLNIGGSRFRTTRDVMRRIPGTFFSMTFSGMYAPQDMYNDGSSIYVDRDGTNFGHILEYMRDGVMSSRDASKTLVRALQRELKFYRINVDLVVNENILLVGANENGWAVDTFDHEKLTIPLPTRGLMRLRRIEESYATLLGKHIYITGGSHYTNDKVVRYSIDDNEWEDYEPMPCGRWKHVSVVVRGELYVIGGQGCGDDHKTVWKLTVESRTWSNVAPMPCVRRTPAACAVGDNIYVFGGQCGFQNLDTVLRYNTMANVWTTLEQRMPFVAADVHAVPMDDGKIYLVGGMLRNTLRFNPSDESFELCQRVPSGDFLRSCFVYEGTLCSTWTPPRGRHDGMIYIHRYNVERDTWTAMRSDAVYRHFGMAVKIRNLALVDLSRS